MNSYNVKISLKDGRVFVYSHVGESDKEAITCAKRSFRGQWNTVIATLEPEFS